MTPDCVQWLGLCCTSRCKCAAVDSGSTFVWMEEEKPTALDGRLSSTEQVSSRLAALWDAHQSRSTLHVHATSTDVEGSGTKPGAEQSAKPHKLAPPTSAEAPQETTHATVGDAMLAYLHARPKRIQEKTMGEFTSFLIPTCVCVTHHLLPYFRPLFSHRL